MKLQNELLVPASVEEAWEVMLDVERVAPCLPGAQITGGQDGRWTGTMKVKIGPITASYDGTIEVAEADEGARRAVLRADARDSRGRGSAGATITSTMEAAEGGTRIEVETDLNVTGPAAQFGRGVMQEVSAKMMDRFADCLATKMGGGGARDTAAPAEAASAEPTVVSEGSPMATADALPDDVPAPPASDPVVRLPGGAEAPVTPPARVAGESEPAAAPERVSAAPAEASREEVLDLGELSRGAVLKRAAPLVGAAAALLTVAAALLRRSRR